MFKTGDIVLVRTKWSWDILSSLITWRIRQDLGSFYNHVAIMGDDGRFVYEVHLNGLRRRKTIDYLTDKRYILEVKRHKFFNMMKPPNREIRRVFIDKFLAKEYKMRKKIKYDLKAIWEIRLNLLLYGNTNRIKAKDDNFYICSEFVQKALEEGGISLGKNLWTPLDFERDENFFTIYKRRQDI